MRLIAIENFKCNLSLNLPGGSCPNLIFCDANCKFAPGRIPLNADWLRGPGVAWYLRNLANSITAPGYKPAKRVSLKVLIRVTAYILGWYSKLWFGWKGLTTLPQAVPPGIAN